MIRIISSLIDNYDDNQIISRVIGCYLILLAFLLFPVTICFFIYAMYFSFLEKTLNRKLEKFKNDKQAKNKY